MPFHFLKLGVKQRDFLHEEVVAFHLCASITIDCDTITNVKGMFDENENDGLEKFLGSCGQQPGER